MFYCNKCGALEPKNCCSAYKMQVKQTKREEWAVEIIRTSGVVENWFNTDSIEFAHEAIMENRSSMGKSSVMGFVITKLS